MSVIPFSNGVEIVQELRTLSMQIYFSAVVLNLFWTMDSLF